MQLCCWQQCTIAVMLLINSATFAAMLLTTVPPLHCCWQQCHLCSYCWLSCILSRKGTFFRCLSRYTYTMFLSTPFFFFKFTWNLC
jgi:hypothetical protein